MAESLGQAQLQLTVAGYDDLIQKLANIKKELNGISSGPIKLQVDGTGTRSKTTSGDRAQGGARESSNALTNAKKTRYKLDQQIQTLERAGVNTSKLRAQLGEATTAQARRQFGSFKQIAGSLQFALTKEKDRLRVQKELNAEKAKDTRVRPISFDGGARESLTAKTDAQSKRARLNQQLNSLEASGVKTTKLRAQLGEATTAQANRQFGTFNQIANKLSDSLRAEREKLKIQRQQTRENEKQVTEEKRIGKGNVSPVGGKVDSERNVKRLENSRSILNRQGQGQANLSQIDSNLAKAKEAALKGQSGLVKSLIADTKILIAAERERLNVLKTQLNTELKEGKQKVSPIRGGIGFDKSPIALEVAARKQQRLAKDLDAGAMERAANRKAKIADRIDYLSTGGRDQSVRSAATPLKPNADAIKAEELLDKARKATAATTEKEAKRIAKDNAAPVGGLRESSDIIKDLNIQRSRLVRESNTKKIPLSDSLKQDLTRLGPQITDAAGKGQIDTVKRLANEVKLLFKEESERLKVAKQTADALKGQKPPGGGGGGGPTGPNGPNGPTRPRKTQAEKDADEAKKKAERLAKQRKQENSARLNSGLVGGAFPLMFGQGGFAALGGAIGGTAGGGPLGFGLSLVGTLVGSQIDELSNRFITLSKALQDPIKSLDVFIEQASLASTAQEKLAKTLIDNGQEGRAESLIAGELSRTIDPAIASRVDANTDNFNRALSDTKDILGQIVAGPSSEFLNFLAGILSIINENDSPPNPNATPEQRRTQTIENATQRKVPAQALGSVSSALIGPALGGILTAALTSGEEKDIRVAKSKEVFALEKKLSKEKKTQQQIEEATLSAQSQGLEDTAKQLSLQAKLAGVTVKETKANKGAAEELERSKFFGFGSGDTKKAEAKRKEIKETAELERKALLAEQAGEKRSSGIKLSNAQRLRGLEGPARDIQTKKNSVSEAQREADSAQQIKNQRIKESTGSTKDKALITAASDAATTANNKLKLSKVELNETTEKAIKLAGRELDLAKSAVKGDRIGSLNKQINNVEEDRNFSLRKLGAGASLQEKEAVNLSADAKVLELQQQKKQLQNDLNQALQSELIIRQGIARQIAASVANQGAALARADAGANPGNSVLAARAGRAEGDAFKAQNQSGINAAKENESQLRNQLRFEPDTSKQTELVDKIRTAAEATKLAYIEAGTALAEKIGAAAASLKGMRDSLRGTLEGNIDLLPGQDVQNLRNMAQADINRGQRNGILRSDLAPAQTDEEQFRQAGFVRSVENQKAQIQSQQELIKALNDNAAAERNITVRIDPGGSPVPVGDRTASTL